MKAAPPRPQPSRRRAGTAPVPRRGVDADLRQHAGEVALRVDAVAFAAGDQRPQPGVVLGRGVVAGEEPVFAADGHALQRPFAGVVVDVEEALRGVGAERVPLVLGVGDRRGHRAAGQHDFAARCRATS